MFAVPLQGLEYLKIRSDRKVECKSISHGSNSCHNVVRVEDPGIDPGTSRMLSERSTI